ncbi:flavodoxin [Spirosoma endophyticum]|nr:flavodoxin [Spirosoma endophyticum]
MRVTAFMMHALLTLVLLVGACSSSQTESVQVTDEPTAKPGNALPGKVLIVYLSRTNNTKALAEIIHKHVGGTLVALDLSTPYPANYQATVQQVARENETGFLPPLKTKIDSIQTYERVFVGFPTWGMQLPPPMKSFLRQYDFSGKTIIPFNSNGGYGIGSTFDTVKQLCPNSNVLEGFTIRGGSERDGQLLVIQGDKAKEAETTIVTWLRKINVLK